MARDYHRQLSVAKENDKHKYILTVDHHSPGLLSQTSKNDWRIPAGNMILRIRESSSLGSNGRGCSAGEDDERLRR